MTVLLVLLTLILIAFVAWLFAMRPSSDAHPFERVMLKHIYAHRGVHNNSHNLIENTLPAFNAAMQNGYGIELDVHLSADGSPVVFHDTNLLDLTGVEADITDMGNDELKRLTVGNSNNRIPFLIEVLNLVNGRVPLLIEVKTDNDNYETLTDAVMRTLKGYNGVYAIQSFDPRVLTKLKNDYPKVMRGQISGYMNETGANLSFARDFALKNMLTNIATKPDFVSYRYEDIDRLPIKLFRKVFDPTVFVWTVKDNSDFRKCRTMKAAPIFDEIQCKKY